MKNDKMKTTVTYKESEDTNDDGTPEYVWYICNKCKNNTIPSKESKFCPNCGKEIEWLESEAKK